MDSLNLNKSQPEAKEQLTRAQMKNVIGGEAPNTWCGHTADNQIHQCGLTKAMAMSWPMYCHDNCPTWPAS